MLYLFPLLCYLLGSLPMAYLLSRFGYGIDIRTQGSGNIGATNALRTLGNRAGAVVLLLDMVKVLLPLTVGRILQLPGHILLYGGAAAVIGHNWPIFLRFKGGKGVAVSAGLLLFFYPVPGLIAVLVFIAVIAKSRYASLASLLCAGIAPLAVYLCGYSDWDVAYTGVLAALLVYQHRGNIQRLLTGSERKLSFSKS